MTGGGAVPAGYEDGWSAPMDGGVFLANIEWRDAGVGGTIDPDRPVRWGPVAQPARDAIGGDAVCFDLLDRSLALRFWRGECWVHSWRPLPGED